MNKQTGSWDYYQGKVILSDYMGGDLAVVNAARVSFGKRKDELDEKDEKLISYLANHKHMCYDAETEVFTDRGWVSWPSVRDEDQLAAVDPNTGFMHYEKPTRLVRERHTGEMYKIEHRDMDMFVTPNHRMFVSRRSHNRFKPYEVCEAKDLDGKQFRLQTTARLMGGQGGSYDEGFLYGFFLCDGYRDSMNRVYFRLKKGRKIKLLDECLYRLGADYTARKSGNVTQFYITNNHSQFTLTSKDKCIDDRAFDMSYEYRRGIYDGMLASDGSRKRNAYTYSTTSKKLAEDFVRLGTTLGECVKINTARNSECYRVMCLGRSTNPRINNSKLNGYITKEWTGMVYCAEVSTGLLLVRRNGHPCISGNSPFRHVQLSLILEDIPEFILRQLFKHQVGMGYTAGEFREAATVWNELSGRYVELNMSFFDIDVFRMQHQSNRQASDPNNLVEDQDKARDIYRDSIAQSYGAYQELLAMGVAKEQARLVIPLAFQTSVIWTGSLEAFVNFVRLRDHEGAQYEIQALARIVREALDKVAPVSTRALMNEGE